MEISQLFFGRTGDVFSYTCIILILIMMFIITLQLFLSRRKKAYLSLTVSLGIIIFQYVLLIVYEVRSVDNIGSAEYMAQLLHVFAFILINMGVFQLYNASQSREFTYLLLFLSGAVVVAAFRYYFVLGEPEPSVQYLQFHNIWIEIYLLLLTFLAFYVISPHIGQSRKYRFALIAYFTAQLARVINHYVLDQQTESLFLIENFLPIMFYIILFMIIFNRVVELLQAIYNSSIKDGLTGLFNRPFFFNRVADYLNRGVKVSIIFCDIDNFKKLNDTKGHQTGDKVLKQVSAILQEVCENIGIAGRYGGEELVMLVTDTSFRVEHIAELIRKRVEEETGVTLSVGFCKYQRGITPQQLIDYADHAMYQSKKTGKNRVTGYLPS